MGVLDFASKVLTSYKADTKEHVRELEKLKGAEKERAREAIEGGKKVEKSLDDQLAKIGKFAVAGAAAFAAMSVAWDGFQEHMEHGRLTAASAGADIERLKKASGGLATEMRLLRDASAMQTGAFKLSQKQMEDVERAMLALNRQGKDATKVHDAVLQAVTALKVDGLADLGIFVDKAGLSMETAEGRAKIFERTMAKLGESSRAAGDGQRSAEEDVMAASVSLQDSWSNLKRSLGELVVSMAPLLDALAKAVGLVADLVRGAGELGRNEHFQGAMDAASGGGVSRLRGMAAERDRIESMGMTAAIKGHSFRADDPYIRAQRISAGWTWDEIQRGERNPRGAAADTPTTLADLQAAIGAVFAADPWESTVPKRGKGKSSPRRRTAYPGREGTDMPGLIAGVGWEADEADFDLTGPLNRQLADKLAAQRAAKGAEQQSFLAKTFGPIEEFNIYAKGFETLTGAVGASMTAWIDGSMSAGQAFKKFVGEALKSLASQMLVESLKHGAYAIGSLAFGDVRGAATHGAAAAAFGAGALAAGVAARALGGGGGASSAASVGGGRGAGAAAPSSGPDRERFSGSNGIVVIGNAFAHDSPRTRRRQAQELVGIATRGAGEVVYS